MGMAEEMHQEGWSPADVVTAESPVRFREMLEVLSGQRSALARELDKGVSPDAFKAGQALLASYDAALDGLEKARQRSVRVR